MNRSLRLLLLVLVGAAVSAGCERCGGCPGEPPRASRRAPLAPPQEGLSVRVTGAGRPDLSLDLVEATLGGEQLRLRAQGPRTGWLYSLQLALSVRDTPQGLAAAQVGGACRVRFLQDGRATEAEMVPEGVSVQAIGRRPGPQAPVSRVGFTLTCRKRFDTRRDGGVYAAPIPETITVTGVAALP